MCIYRLQHIRFYHPFFNGLFAIDDENQYLSNQIDACALHLENIELEFDKFLSVKRVLKIFLLAGRNQSSIGMKKKRDQRIDNGACRKKLSLSKFISRVFRETEKQFRETMMTCAWLHFNIAASFRCYFAKGFCKGEKQLKVWANCAVHWISGISDFSKLDTKERKSSEAKKVVRHILSLFSTFRSLGRFNLEWHTYENMY